MEYITIVLRAYLLLFTTYHIITGSVSVFFPGFSRSFYLKLYDFHFELTPEIFLILKPWGALNIAVGIAAFFAYTDPVRYQGVLYSLAVLLCFRACYRYIYRFRIQEVFKTGLQRNYVNIVLVTSGASLISLWILGKAFSG
jgi:hypothetical protein